MLDSISSLCNFKFSWPTDIIVLLFLKSAAVVMLNGRNYITRIKWFAIPSNPQVFDCKERDSTTADIPSRPNMKQQHLVRYYYAIKLFPTVCHRAKFIYTTLQASTTIFATKKNVISATKKDITLQHNFKPTTISSTNLFDLFLLKKYIFFTSSTQLIYSF